MQPCLQAPPRNTAFQYMWCTEREVEACKCDWLQGNNHNFQRAGLEWIVCLNTTTCYKLSHIFSVSWSFSSHLGVIRIKEQPSALTSGWQMNLNKSRIMFPKGLHILWIRKDRHSLSKWLNVCKTWHSGGLHRIWIIGEAFSDLNEYRMFFYVAKVFKTL